MSFSERLKTVRLERGYTQKDMYMRINISPNGYASYEQGRTEPNIETLIKICKILNISSDYLLGLEDDNGVKTYNNYYNNYGTQNGDVNF